MNKVNSGVWAGAVIFVFFLCMLILSFKYSYTSMYGPGPGFFPTWLCSILMALSLLYIYDEIRGKNRTSETWPTGKSLRRVLFVVMSLFVFVFSVVVFGFIVAIALFMFLLYWGSYKWYLNLIISVGIALLLYWLFNDILGIYLPTNSMIF